MKTITPPSTPLLIEDLGTLYATEKSTRKERFGLYKCSCGNEFKTLIKHINNGHTKSCGCHKNISLKSSKTKAFTHRLSRHPLYCIWNNMVQRCISKRELNFNSYASKDIKVCERWQNVNNFIKDTYSTYKYGLSIDRIDNNKGYSPDNCRWTTKEIQCRNTRVLKSTNKSGYRGVWWHKKSNKWYCGIVVSNKKIYLGLFDTAIEAAKAYDNYVIDNGLEHTINFHH